MTSSILFCVRDRATYGWLSNFHPSPLVDQNGQVWKTAEHAYQAMKSRDPQYRESVLRAATPQIAKQLGRRVQLRPDWQDIRLTLMARILGVKFGWGSDLGHRLVETAPADLVEDAPWDSFWGTGRDGGGLNQLGQLLVEQRNWLIDTGVETDAYREDAR